VTSPLPCPRTSNPFSTRRVRPGAIPFLFPGGESLAGLLARLRATNWWGQIIGPHGSGKSTLLAALLPELRRAGREPLLNVLHDGQRRLPEDAWQHGNGHRILVVDGYEQLHRWTQFWILRHCRRRGQGLLVTAHADAGLPDLYRTAVTPAAARRVVEFLTTGMPSRVTPPEVEAPLAARQGNLREALFDLYDLHERRRAE
jgi:hypothetical protein